MSSTDVKKIPPQQPAMRPEGIGLPIPLDQPTPDAKKAKDAVVEVISAKELQRLTSEVKGMGVDLSDLYIDGKLPREKYKTAQERIAKAAEAMKKKDPYGAARLYQRALRLDPKNIELAIITAKTLKEYADSLLENKENAEVKKTLYFEALAHLHIFDVRPLTNGEFSRLKSGLHQWIAQDYIAAKNFKMARAHLFEAVKHGNPDEVTTLFDFLKGFKEPGLLRSEDDPYSFVGRALTNGYRFEEALAIYLAGVQDAEDPTNRAYFIKCAHIIDEAINPYQPKFNESNNPLIDRLYRSLRKKGLSSAEIKGKMKTEKFSEDRTIRAVEVFSFIKKNLNSPEVREALQEAGIKVPEKLSKSKLEFYQEFWKHLETKTKGVKPTDDLSQLKFKVAYGLAMGHLKEGDLNEARECLRKAATHANTTQLRQLLVSIESKKNKQEILGKFSDTRSFIKDCLIRDLGSPDKTRSLLCDQLRFLGYVVQTRADAKSDRSIPNAMVLNDEGVPSDDEVQSILARLRGNKEDRGSLKWATRDIKLPVAGKELSSKERRALERKIVWAAFRDTELPQLPQWQQREVLKRFVEEMNLSEEDKKNILGGMSTVLDQFNAKMTFAKRVSYDLVWKARTLREKGEKLIAEGNKEEGKKLQELAQERLRLAIHLDPSNPTAQRWYGVSLAEQGDLKGARGHFVQAIQLTEDFKELRLIQDFVKVPKYRAILKKGETSLGFIGDTLLAAGRDGLALTLYEKAIKSTKDPKLKKRLTEKLWRAKEKTISLNFEEKDNPIAFKIYQALRSQKIPSGMMTKHKVLSKYFVNPRDVFSYVGKNFDDLRVQAALKEAGIQIPKELQDDIKSKGFGRVMAEYHASEAKKLQGTKDSEELKALQTHLENATYFDPKNAANHEALGDFYLYHVNAFAAVRSYRDALRWDSKNEDLKKKMVSSYEKAVDKAISESEKYLKAGEIDKARWILRDMMETQFSLAESNPEIFLRPEICSKIGKGCVLLGQIYDREGKHQKEAVPLYLVAVTYLTPVLIKDPNNKEALVLRANAFHNLREYKAALQDLQSLPEGSPEVAQYKKGLEGLLKRCSEERMKLEGEPIPNHHKIALFLTEEIKVHEALGNREKVAELSAKLKTVGTGISLDELTQEVQVMAQKGLIDHKGMERFKDLAPKGVEKLLNPTNLTELGDYVSVVTKKGKRVLKFTKAYEALDPQDKYAVLQALKQTGMRAAFVKQAKEAKDPTKKLFYQSKIDLMDGNFPAARVKMIEFKALTEDIRDPEIKKMREENCEVLRKLSLDGVRNLKRMVGSMMDRQDIYLDARAAELDRLTKIEELLNQGAADTIEEASKILEEFNLKKRQEGVAKTGDRFDIYYTPPAAGSAEDAQEGRQIAALRDRVLKGPVDPATFAEGRESGVYSNIPTVTLKGGMVDVPLQEGGGPRAIALVVGTEGGTINWGGTSYYIKPSGRERVLLLDEHGVRGAESQFDWESGRARSKPDAIKDPLCQTLLELETRAGLEKRDTPDGKRKTFLSVAMQLRRAKQYALAEEFYQDLFLEEFNAALDTIGQDRVREIRKEVEEDRPDTEETVRKQIEEFKKKNPDGYAKEFPDGLTQEKLEERVKLAIESQIEMKLRQEAYKIMAVRHKAGLFENSEVAAAWNEYNDMEDPNGEFFNLADRTWDSIKQEVCMMVVTMPISMGVGSIVRGGVASTKWVVSLARMGGKWGPRAAKAIIYTAGVFAEAAAQTGLECAITGEEFTFKRFGYNLAMTSGFHGGAKLWEKAAQRQLGEAAMAEAVEALQKAVQSGDRVAIRAAKWQLRFMRAANTAGNLGTQFVLSTGGTYAEEIIFDTENPQTFWERLGGSVIRMVAMHYGSQAFNMATGGVFMRNEALAYARIDKAHEVFHEAIAKKMTPDEAKARAIEAAKKLQMDEEGMLFTPDEDGTPIYELRDHEIQILTPDEEALWQARLRGQKEASLPRIIFSKDTSEAKLNVEGAPQPDREPVFPAASKRTKGWEQEPVAEETPPTRRGRDSGVDEDAVRFAEEETAPASVREPVEVMGIPMDPIMAEAIATEIQGFVTQARKKGKASFGEMTEIAKKLYFSLHDPQIQYVAVEQAIGVVLKSLDEGKITVKEAHRIVDALTRGQEEGSEQKKSSYLVLRRLFGAINREDINPETARDMAESARRAIDEGPFKPEEVEETVKSLLSALHGEAFSEEIPKRVLQQMAGKKITSPNDVEFAINNDLVPLLLDNPQEFQLRMELSDAVDDLQTWAMVYRMRIQEEKRFQAEEAKRAQADPNYQAKPWDEALPKFEIIGEGEGVDPFIVNPDNPQELIITVRSKKDVKLLLDHLSLQAGALSPHARHPLRVIARVSDPNGQYFLHLVTPSGGRVVVRVRIKGVAVEGAAPRAREPDLPAAAAKPGKAEQPEAARQSPSRPEATGRRGSPDEVVDSDRPPIPPGGLLSAGFLLLSAPEMSNLLGSSTVSILAAGLAAMVGISFFSNFFRRRGAPKSGEASLPIPWGSDGAEGARAILGREGMSTLRFNGRISNRHAQIDWRSDQSISITDLSSSNGTFVFENGRWVRLEPNKPHSIKVGQVFALADGYFKLGEDGSLIPTTDPLAQQAASQPSPETAPRAARQVIPAERQPAPAKPGIPVSPEGAPPVPSRGRPTQGDNFRGAAEGRVLMDVATPVGETLASFQGKKPSVADRHNIPGLSRERARQLEASFERGGYAWKNKYTGRLEWVQRPSARASIRMMQATEADVAFFNFWRREQGSPQVDRATALKAWEEIQARAKKLGIEIGFDREGTNFPDSPQAAEELWGRVVVINELLKMLPDSFLKNSKLRGIVLDVQAKGGEAAYSEFSNGVVYLYDVVFNNTRRQMLGFLLHELGHSTAQRYEQGTTGDPSIPGAFKARMQEAFATLLNRKALLGLDFGGGASERIFRQEMGLGEFLAEMHLIYVAAGPKLRARIDSLPKGSEVRAAWEFVYSEMRSRVFGGREFGYAEGTAEAKPQVSEGAPPARKRPPPPPRRRKAPPQIRRQEPPAPEPEVPVAKPGEPAAPEAPPVQKPVKPPKVSEKEATRMLDEVLPELSFGQKRQKVNWRHREEDWGGIAAASDRGRYYKSQNQDRYEQVVFSDGRVLLIAIDGMGGAEGGERAAEISRAVIKKAATEGRSPEEALQLADAAVYEDSKRSGFTESNGQPKLDAPGAVAMVVEVVPQADGTYRARFLSVGDAEALVLRPGGDPPIVHSTLHPTDFINQMRQDRGAEPFAVSPDGLLRRGQTLDLRGDPYGNIVDAALGIKSGRLFRSAPDQPLQEGDIIIAGSDGLFECFGSLAIINKVIERSGAKTAAEVRDALMQEALIRMNLLQNTQGKAIEHSDYVAAYRDVTGRDPPESWRGMYEPWVDAQGTQHYYGVDRSGKVFKYPGGEWVDHFKQDNVSVLVQVVGEAISGPTVDASAARPVSQEGTAPPPDKLPVIPVHLDPPAEAPRTGDAVGLVIGGMKIEGMGKTIPQDGSLHQISDNSYVKYENGRYYYSIDEPSGRRWVEVEVGQSFTVDGRDFSLVELGGKLNGDFKESFNDLKHQVDYQLATHGVRQHLLARKAKGESVAEVDAENLSLFYSENFNEAQSSYDDGSPFRTQGGLMGGTTEVFAFVDPQTGKIYRFATRTPKGGGQRGRTSYWTVVKVKPDNTFYWINSKDPQKIEPVSTEGIPPGAEIVPMTLERMTGRIRLDPEDLEGLNLSEAALQRMENIDGFVGATGGAAIQALGRYITNPPAEGPKAPAARPVSPDAQPQSAQAQEGLARDPQGENSFFFKMPRGQEVFTIGRDHQPLSDGTVSRTHIKIYREDGRILLQDMGSTSGTDIYSQNRNVIKIPGRRGKSSDPVEVHPGDIVRIGRNTWITIQ